MFLVHEHDHANSLGGDLISISEIPFEFVWGLMQPCLNHPTPTPKDQEGVIQWDKEPPSLTTFSSKLILRWKVVSVTQGEEAGFRLSNGWQGNDAIPDHGSRPFFFWNAQHFNQTFEGLFLESCDIKMPPSCPDPAYMLDSDWNGTPVEVSRPWERPTPGLLWPLPLLQVRSQMVDWFVCHRFDWQLASCHQNEARRQSIQF